MIEWLLDPLNSAFVSRALLTGILVSAIAAVVGPWVIVRGMTFLGEAIGHGMLPGVAIASVFSINLFYGAALSAIAMVVGVNSLRRDKRLGQDTNIGLLYLGLLSLGVIIVSYSTSFTGDLTSFLFGDILGVSQEDFLLLIITLVVVIGVVIYFYRRLFALSFDFRKAQTLGLKPASTNLILLLLIVASITASFQAVGTLLAFGMLIAPSATALLIIRNIPKAMFLAFVIGSVTTYIGLLISWHFDSAAGATIAFSQIVLFFIVKIAKALSPQKTLQKDEVLNS